MRFNNTPPLGGEYMGEAAQAAVRDMKKTKLKQNIRRWALLLTGAANSVALALLAPAGVLRDDAVRGNLFGTRYDPLDPPEFVELFGNVKLGRQYITTAFRLPIYETAARYSGPALIVHGTADRVVPYTYGLRFHQEWAGSDYVELDAFDHGFSQNIYRACDIVSSWLIRKLR